MSVALIYVYLQLTIHKKRNLVAILALHVHVRAMLVMSHVHAVVKVFKGCRLEATEIINLLKEGYLE